MAPANACSDRVLTVGDEDIAAASDGDLCRLSLDQFHCSSWDSFLAEGLSQRHAGCNSRERNSVASGFESPKVEVCAIRFRVGVQVVCIESKVPPLRAFAVAQFRISQPVRVGLRIAIGSQENRTRMVCQQKWHQ